METYRPLSVWFEIFIIFIINANTICANLTPKLQNSFETSENERQVELRKLSEHPCRLVVVDRNFEQSLQNACRNLSKEGLKIKFESMLTENTKNVQVAPTIGIGKAIAVVNYTIKK